MLKGRYGLWLSIYLFRKVKRGEMEGAPCLALFYFGGRLLEDLLQEYSLFRRQRQTERKGNGRIHEPLDDDTCVAALDFKREGEKS